MELFKYSPGLMGPGLKGTDGSNGLAGLSVMFTDLDPYENGSVITNKIELNQILWSGFNADLGNQRTYQTGDLFVDKRGEIYEIDLSNPIKFGTKGLNLTTFNYFVKNINDKENTNALKRYSNDVFQPNYYLLDNINTVEVKNYAPTNSRSYNIEYNDFTRIEFCDIEKYSLNAFSLYIAHDSCSNKSLALIRKNDNVFHIGNLYEDEESIRPTDLTFDVRNLKVNNNTNAYDEQTLAGTVLSNHEIAINHLFNQMDRTISNVKSFGLITDVPGSMKVYCNKYHLLETSDTHVVNDTTVDIHFYKPLEFDGDFYQMTSVNVQPLVINNVDASITIVVSGLDSGEWESFLTVTYNGWSRKTASIRNSVI